MVKDARVFGARSATSAGPTASSQLGVSIYRPRRVVGLDVSQPRDRWSGSPSTPGSFRRHSCAALPHRRHAREFPVKQVHSGFERFQKGGRFHEVGLAEPFGVCAVERLEHRESLGNANCSSPEPSEAHRGPQLPRAALLSPGGLNRLTEALLGTGVAGRFGQQEAPPRRRCSSAS